MKATILIATAAALLGTAAIAQTTTNPTGTDSTTLPATGMPADSSAPAMAPAATTDSNAQAMNTDTSNYPACSRTVTDKCVQRGAWHKAHAHH